ncbi:MAG: tRNA pseudouridine(13) synthase TruD [Planctomycetota bacterium]|nr:tRNA pseudouridine(13) synthase TruD [Planctomycetota bacterium]
MDLITQLKVEDPSPNFRLFNEGIGGRIKVRAEDFQVEEIPWRDPTGEGKHLHVFVEKTATSHGELMAVVAKAFGCDSRDVGFAGMKDKAAVTRQWISLPADLEASATHLNHERVRLLGTIRSDRALRRGDLRGNRFVIKIREIDPLKTPTVGRMLERIEKDGLPAFFGPQRFGYRQNNHRLGGALLNGSWQAVLDELLGPSDGNHPANQATLREAWVRQDEDVLCTGWPSSQRFEMLAARTWVKHRDPEKAVRAGGRTTLNFLTSAFSSFLFNQMLEERCRRGLLHVDEPGDLTVDPLKKTPMPIAEGGLPSALFWGQGAEVAQGVQGEIESRVLAKYQINPGWLHSPWVPRAERRPLRFHLSDPGVEGGFDEHGGYIEVRFTLPRGMFATVVAAEILGPSTQTSTDEDQSNPKEPSM